MNWTVSGLSEMLDYISRGQKVYATSEFPIGGWELEKYVETRPHIYIIRDHVRGLFRWMPVAYGDVCQANVFKTETGETFYKITASHKDYYYDRHGIEETIGAMIAERLERES